MKQIVQDRRSKCPLQYYIGQPCRLYFETAFVFHIRFFDLELRFSRVRAYVPGSVPWALGLGSKPWALAGRALGPLGL